MLRKRIASAVSVVVMFVLAVGPAQRPDFSGEWQTSGTTLTIKQSESVLMVDGGLVVMEAFAKPENRAGFDVVELNQAFRRFRILSSERLVAKPDWDTDNDRPIGRFIAQKPD